MYKKGDDQQKEEGVFWEAVGVVAYYLMRVREDPHLRVSQSPVSRVPAFDLSARSSNRNIINKEPSL